MRDPCIHVFDACLTQIRISRVNKSLGTGTGTGTGAGAGRETETETETGTKKVHG